MTDYRIQDAASLPASGGQPYGTPEDKAGGRRQFEQILDLLYRRRMIVISTFLIVSTIAAAYALTRPPEYRASTVVVVNLSRSASANPAVTGVSTGNNVFATNDRTLAGELFLIQSSYTIAQRVNMRLREAVENQDSTQERRLTYPPRGNVNFAPATRDANAIRVTGVSSDPYEAALLANLYAEEYIRLTQDASRTYMSQSRSFLEEQQNARRAELNRAEEQVKQYQQQTGMVGLDASGSAIVSQLSGMEAQRDNALIELQMRESSLEVVQNELQQISPQLAQRLASGVDQRISAIQNRLQELEVNKQVILLRYSGQSEDEIQHSDLPVINRQITQLRSELNELSEEYVNEVSAAGGIASGERGLSVVADLRNRAVQLNIEISGLRSRIENMNARIRQYEAELGTIPDRSLQLARLERERQQKAQMYEYVVERLQQVRISEESEPGYAHVIREAGVPSVPAGPDVPRYIIYGLLFGAMLGVGLAVARDKLDNRIYKPDQLRDGKYSLLTVIPNMRPLIREDHGGQDFVSENGRSYSTGLTALLNPISTVSEAYRQLRTNIQFSRLDTPVQAIMVTSPGIGEGKSTTAANLAMVMAQAGRRTVMIDCDLRRPQIHRLLGRKCYPGLVQMLFDDPNYSIEDARTEIDNLYVITAGEIVDAGGDGATDYDEDRRDGGMVVANPA
ncbi:MAG: GumC family protein, partial [Rhodothermales bacterium]